MNARRLRIYVGERAKDPRGHVLHETILDEAHRRGLAGATVLRAVAGFAGPGEVHTAKILRLSDDLPMVVEIVDTADKLDVLIPWLREVVRDGLVTVENVEVLISPSGGARS